MNIPNLPVKFDAFNVFVGLVVVGISIYFLHQGMQVWDAKDIKTAIPHFVLSYAVFNFGTMFLKFGFEQWGKSHVRSAEQEMLQNTLMRLQIHEMEIKLAILRREHLEKYGNVESLIQGGTHGEEKSREEKD